LSPQDREGTPVSRPSLRKTITGLCEHCQSRLSCEKPIQWPAARAHRGPSLFSRPTSNRNLREEGNAILRGQLSSVLPPRTAVATNLVRTRSLSPLSPRANDR